jgi:hypothetical protein
MLQYSAGKMYAMIVVPLLLPPLADVLLASSWL